MYRRLTMALVIFSLLTAGGANCCADQSQPLVRAGSKAFTESVVLGEMLELLISDAGGRAEHLAELGGTQICWKALLAGEIDCYVEYTGTIQQEILNDNRPYDEDAMRRALAERGIVMGRPLGFSNTYALGMPESLANQLNLQTISDLAACPEMSRLKMRFSDEFLERTDGWRGLRAKYGFPEVAERGIDHSLAYRGLQSGSHQVTDVFTTDAEIRLYHVRVLEDDRRYFPPYQAVLISRSDLEARAPQVALSLARLESLFDNQAMIDLTARVKQDRIAESQVAAEFLQARLNLNVVSTENAPASSWKRASHRLVDNLKQHLLLVVASLAAAIVVAVPLGVLAFCRPRLGRLILTGVGIVQTLPAMAVLVFTIPLLGLGAYPAIFALFLYSLLPIVRNTFTGLSNIPANLRESADALGLSSSARLRLIEMPMASTSILAGIKTAAVINVGTATIGALVGAGGFGQPILTGIRLDDFSLILQGAIPAALLAMAVQATFGIVEMWLVPAGLRITKS